MRFVGVGSLAVLLLVACCHEEDGAPSTSSPTKATASAYAGPVPSAMPLEPKAMAIWLADLDGSLVPSTTNFAIAWSPGDCGDVVFGGASPVHFEHGACDPCVRGCAAIAADRLGESPPIGEHWDEQRGQSVVAHALACARACPPVNRDQ